MSENNRSEVPCPICGESISENASKCHECGEYITIPKIAGKAVWDLIKLIIIPVSLLILGSLITQYQREQDALADKNQANADALEAYLDDMTLLLLEEDLEAANVRTAAKARTVALLRELEPEGYRRTIVFAFLREAELIKWILAWSTLAGVDLSGVDLTGVDLTGTNLAGAQIDEETVLDEKWQLVWEIVNEGAVGENFSGADLSGANLSGVDLSGVNLSGADLSGANLYGTTIDDSTVIDEKWRKVWEIVNEGAAGEDLSGADLSGANLSGAELSGANLSGANLDGAILRDADLAEAQLTEATLSNSDLSEAVLSGAVVTDATLTDATLTSTDISGADLSGATTSDLDLSDLRYDANTIWPEENFPRALP